MNAGTLIKYGGKRNELEEDYIMYNKIKSTETSIKEEKYMTEYEELGYLSEDEYLEDILGCDEDWTLDDYFDSYDPE